MSASNGIITVSKVTKNLLVTHLDSIGPYLTVFGQLNGDTMEAVRSNMLKMYPNCFSMNGNWLLERQVLQLRPDALCLIKQPKHRDTADASAANVSMSDDDNYELMRARIISSKVALTGVPMLEVLVEFIDYGYQAYISSFELFFPKQQHLLGNIPAQCSPFILLGICHKWERSELDQIMRVINREKLEICVQFEFLEYKFITMKWNEFNFVEFLIQQQKLGAPIANELLMDNFKKYHQDHVDEQFITKEQAAQLREVNAKIIESEVNFEDRIEHNNRIYNNMRPPQVRRLDMTRPTYIQMFARRSLASRLQLYHHQPAQQQLLMQRPPVQSQSGDYFQSILPGGNNSRIPFTGAPAPSTVASAAQSSPPYLVRTATIRPSVTLSPNVAPFRPAAMRGLSSSAPAVSSNGTHTSLQGVDAPTKSAPPPKRTTFATFRTSNLSVGKTYDVCVSFVENGPCLFNVQLASAQADLTAMMTQIERLPLRSLTEKPAMGSACIARYSEDGQLYRALIIDVQPHACKVGYVDYGNGELVKFQDLYEIPEEVRDAKAYAVRFTLAGHRDLEPIDESLKKAFKDLVIYKDCKLKVVPPEGPPLVQYCELYLQNTNILDVLKNVQKSRLVYAKAEHLQNNDIVEIRYIDSPKHFYVQKVSNITAFELLMDDMFLHYNKNQVVPNHLALGAPCIVKYENEWYRAEVMRADASAIVVRHVDFGYEQKVTKNLLSTVAEKHLELPRQAVQCCLKGFENNELNKDLATTQFEMLAEASNRQRRSFTVKVFRIEPDGVNLVNLCTKDLNVMKKLYKLSMPFEQYLTLEKQEFNLYGQRRSARPAGSAVGGDVTPSIASSNDESTTMRSVGSNGAAANKHNIAYSTPLQLSPQELPKTQPSPKGQQSPKQQQSPKSQQSTKQQSPKPLLQPQSPQKAQNFNKNNSTTSIEWDLNSSASSMEQRDSRSSSSSERKQASGKRQQHEVLRNGRDPPAQSLLNSSMSSNGSVVERRSNGSGNRQRVAGGGGSDSGNGNSPNHQRHKNNNDNNRQQQQQVADNRRNHNNNNNNSPQQNAPKGYSQPRLSPQQQQHNRSSDTQLSDASESSQQQPDFLPLDRPFDVVPIATPTTGEDVLISWWLSPYQFYAQLKRRTADYERLAADMRSFYKRQTWQPLALRVGSHIVARHRRDNALHRGTIVACNQMLRRYKVHCVDVGLEFMAAAEDIWAVERRFAQLPTMAYACGFAGIVSNFDQYQIIDCIEKYLPPSAQLRCDFLQRRDNVYSVEVSVNGMSMRKSLVADGIIAEVCPELRLDLLASQQIRAKVTAIKDMLNFKVELHGCDKTLQLLCSYDDVRYVKSNPDVAQQFKQFYMQKTCVFNIKDVNDAKVLLLRPLLPLLKDDGLMRICSQPIVLETFKVRVAHVASAYRLFVQLVTGEDALASLLDDMYAYYEQNDSPLQTYEANQFCVARSGDDNWYRARIVNNTPKAPVPGDDVVEVLYPDYGNKEVVSRTLLKKLQPQFCAGHDAYAIELNLPLRTAHLEQRHQHHGRNKAAKRDTPTTAAVSDESVMAELVRLTIDENGQGFVLTVKALEVRHNHLIADVMLDSTTLPADIGRSIVDVLREKKLVKGRDVEFMRKVIDKEPPNRLDYIEVVDLTEEDEEETGGDGEKRPGSTASNKTSSVSSSPKKKKPIKTEVDKRADKMQPPPSPPQVVQTAPEIIASPPPQPPVQVSVPEPPKALATEEQTALEAVEGTGSVDPSTVATAAPAVEPQLEEQVATPLFDAYSHMEQAILSHCDNPAQFFIHSLNEIEELRKLQENLQIVASSLPPLMRVINGAHCISHYSVDKQWYRAQIMDAELMVLQFIDYGNTDCVTDTTDVKEMSVFPDIAPLCQPVALPIRPNGTADWVDAANAIFNDSYSKVLYFEYLTRADARRPRSYIQLHIDGVNIAERLVQDGYALPLQLVSSGESCFISHMNSIGDFYIQYEKDAKTLELIELYLGNEKNLPPLEKFEFGKIVAALFPDDQQWYRAKLLRELPEQGGYEVLFIDYGNMSVSLECREIGDGVAHSCPSLSQKCALDTPANCAAWSEAAEKKFAEFAALGETIFTVDLREPAADLAVVHLFVDGRNIADDLEPLCEPMPLEAEANVSFGGNTTLPMSVCEVGVSYDGVVSHINSPLDFYVQLNKDFARLEDLTATLNALGMDPVKEPEVGQICAALFSNDGHLYRARVLEVIEGVQRQYRVLFVDFGNEALADDLRVLPQDLVQLQPFATHCRIQQEIVEAEAFNASLLACENIVTVEFVDCESDPAVVDLYSSIANIGRQLAIMCAPDDENAMAKLYSAMQERRTMCFISHAYSPAHFYIQRKEDSPQMELVAKALLKVDDKQNRPPKLLLASTGSTCIVYVAEENCYNRGRVQQVLGNGMFEVFLIDYGNSLVVELSSLRSMPEEICDIPPLASHCMLIGIPPVAGDSERLFNECFQALIERHFGEMYEIRREERNPDKGMNCLTLKIGYKDLAELLAAEFNAAKAALAVAGPEEVSAALNQSTAPELHDCTIIHANSPASFYVLLADDIGAVENITKELLDTEQDFKPLAEPFVGVVCAAQFPDDLVYYRARVVRLLEGEASGQCEVHFLDFGNNAITDQLRELPEHLLSVEAYGRHCSLDTQFALEKEATAHFLALVDSRFVETFQIEFMLRSTKLNVCRLFYQDKNVAGEVTQLLQPANGEAKIEEVNGSV